MATPFFISIDLNKFEILNARFQNLAVAPTTPGVGQFYFDTTGGQLCLKVWDGTAWIAADARRATGIPISALATDPTARANHSGTQLAATISDFASTVTAIKWNTLATPTTAVNIGGQVLNNVGSAVSDTDGINLGQAKALLFGTLYERLARAMATGNVSIATPGTATFDGVTLTNGQILFLGNNQTDATQRGTWVFNGTATPLTRALDADGSSELQPGFQVFVSEGATLGNRRYKLYTDGAITVGTTALDFQDISAVGSTYTAGNGVDITGSVISAKVVTGGNLTNAVGGLDVDTTKIARKKVLAINGTGALASFVLNHGIGTQDVSVSVRETTGLFRQVWCEVQMTDGNNVTVIFGVNVPNGTNYSAVIVG